MAEYDRINVSFDGITPATTEDVSLPPIILLHGMKMTKCSWRNLKRSIANGTGRTVLALNARNHGDSGWSDKHNNDVFTRDILNFIESLHYKKVILIGHSMGGKTAMKIALEKPEIVEKLIVEDYTPIQQPPFNERPQRFLLFELQKQSIEAIPPEVKYVDEAQKFVASYISGRCPQEIRTHLKGFLDPSSLPIVQEEDGKFRWHFNMSVIEKAFLEDPTMHAGLEGLYENAALFIYGGKSPYNVIKDKDCVLKVFPKASFKEIEGASHYVHTEYPEQFVQEVVDFIRSN